MELHILEHRVRVLSLARPGLWLYTHPLIKLLFLPRRSRCKFFSLTETPEDYTLMVDEEGFKELPPSEFLQVAEATWLVLNVSSHSGATVQAAGVTKIARSVIAPLAEHHVSVLMLSTYQTDFILVREQDLSVVIHTLAQEFDIYREVGGEPVPVARDDSSNGFPRAQHAGPSPTVHPIQSPQNRFCVLTLDPETLPAIATTLIDVLFYSYSAPKEAASGSPGPSCITFFAFSLIEGYISIVMDAETQKKFPSDLLLTSSSGELWRMMNVALWPRSQDPWLRLTSLLTTSAPSTLTMPWCPRTASAVSLRSSGDGKRARAPEAHREQLPCSPFIPRLPETSLSYFLKLWDKSSCPLPPVPAGGPLLPLCT
ncbi:cytosolic arginine sensor for mTORC1 subunit 1 isoform X1 [Manis javanica]|uniref:cytosolic arginine sensor for mTORC1 subunit 1 isoform X1 n=1 Tax=Manis javanica TaxID=9974 RepID=UPI00187A7BA0|nr:cytosolic arginine sensor for mTORC1 subunit 1 isoform X1 [Manis javanica]